MYGKALSHTECVKYLNEHGFYFVRQNGGHAVFKNDKGQTFVLATGHPISQKTWKRECRKVGIEDDRRND